MLNNPLTETLDRRMLDQQKDTFFDEFTQLCSISFFIVLFLDLVTLPQYCKNSVRDFAHYFRYENTPIPILLSSYYGGKIQ